MVDWTDAGGAPLPLDQALDASGDSAFTGMDAGLSLRAHAEVSAIGCQPLSAVRCSGALALAHHN